MSYTTTSITTSLLEEIKKALQSLSYGSIEIYVHDKTVTQISIRSIKKTSFHLPNSQNGKNNSYVHQNGSEDNIEVLTIKK